MDTKKILMVMIAVSFLVAVTVPALATPFNTTLPPANQSMHNVEQSEQRNRTPGGAGIPGGTNPYFPSLPPWPSPTAKP